MAHKYAPNAGAALHLTCWDWETNIQGCVKDYAELGAKNADFLVTDVSDRDRKSTRLNSSHLVISYAVFCLKKKKTRHTSWIASQQASPAPSRPIDTVDYCDLVAEPAYASVTCCIIADTSRTSPFSLNHTAE